MPAEPSDLTEQQRAAYLLDAQDKALALFDEIQRTLLRPGATEAGLSKEIFSLAAERYGVKTHWHKRVVRSGPHTLHPYDENPPDRTLEAGDILFVDLGPVFEAWEADFGRTYCLEGADEFKCKLRDTLEPAWEKTKARYLADPDMTGNQLFDIAKEEAQKAGYEFGGPIAGHLVGHFPHQRIPRDKVTLYITDGSDQPMSRLDANGRKYHWILEMHLVDRERQIGGFFEQLLTVG
ncbi:Creatinase/aminopeptidase [Cryphonectria parasitica EP155]|uniref:Creatinase/aminopeptidase n=1 Tax=Cryphonectria parasitica (strain ATCC 38755 / EP155) TaxID=660469 RepID=A0A9P4XVW6_CRYP1|nr:Creatinase/aminopeptidase [Cryphonectria parasitica EP155]KAF3762262.1 Creatinase/aminopeptidase [Cryphonectria parasitica EP155]